MTYRINPLAFWLYARDALQIACELAFSNPEMARDLATCVYLGSRDAGDYATARQATALLGAL